MYRMGRILCCLVVFASVLASFSTLWADWLTEALTLSNRGGDGISLTEAQQKGEAMRRAAHELVLCAQKKDQLVEELLAGKMTLLETAACFCSLYDEPQAWRDPRCAKPSRAEGERWCRLVIDWAQSKISCEKSPRAGRIVRQRLEDELDEHRRYHCMVELPDKEKN